MKTGSLISAAAFAALLLSGCSSGSEDAPPTASGTPNSSSECTTLKRLPSELKAPVAAAAAGQASSEDKRALTEASGTLRVISEDSQTSRELADSASDVAALLDKLGKGEVLTEADVEGLDTTFKRFGKAVDTRCG